MKSQYQCTECQAEYDSGSGLRKHVRTKHPDKYSPRPYNRRKPQPLSPDDVVEAVLRAIYGDAIPISDLQAVDRWRRATESFIALATMQDRDDTTS